MSEKGPSPLRAINVHSYIGFSKPTLCISPEATLSPSRQITLSSRVSKYAILSELHPVFSICHNRGLRLYLRLEGKLRKGPNGNVILEMTDEEKKTAIDSLWEYIGVQPPRDGITEERAAFEETVDFIAQFNYPDNLRIDQESQLSIIEFGFAQKVSILENELRELRRSFESCCAEAKSRNKRRARTDVTATVEECMSLTPSLTPP